MSLHRRNPRRDSNEAAIVDALHRCGFAVTSLSGKGVPDLLVSRRQQWYLIEVKRPKGPRGGVDGRTLTPEQTAFKALHRAPVAVIRTPLEAVEWSGVVG